MRNDKIELLAPCGTIEAFHAALDAGADAVYMGMEKFNARLRQKNFTAQTLSYLIPYAHKNGVKVYVAANTLVKDGEIPLFVNECAVLKQLKPDALIVQDWGMAAMLKKYFSEMPLHASTQIAIHNSMQVKHAQDFGFARVVAARELTLAEIRKITNKTSCEIELFVHGALCYSISGRCLASSYLGRSSANRGHCTQVCRRFYSETAQKKGFYFSPKDFWAIDFAQEYRNIGVTSLKIEGRMKGAEYVYCVVGAYRDFLDKKIDLETAKRRLSHDFGRQKCTFLLDGENETGVVSASRQAGTGNYVGEVAGIDGRELILELHGEVPQEGDRLRFHSTDGEEGSVLKVLKVTAQEDNKFLRIAIDTDFKISGEGSLFIISRRNPLIKHWKTKKIHVKPVKFDAKKGIPAGKIMSEIDREAKPYGGKPKLFLRGDNIEWLRRFRQVKSAEYILNVSKSAWQLDFDKEKLSDCASQIIIALPQFIPEGDISMWKSAVEYYKKNRITKFMVANMADRGFFDENDKVFADYPLWALNRYAQKAVLDAGFCAFSYSPEDDILNLKRCGCGGGLFYVFMKVALFVSRIKPLVKDGKTVVDSMGGKFLLREKDGLSYLLGENALGLTHRIDKLSQFGIRNFALDFSFFPSGGDALFREVLSNYERRSRISASVLFNHKGGLK